MVLESVRIRIALLALAVLSSVCGGRATAQEFRAAGYTLELRREADRCVVRFSGAQTGQLTVAPGAPCEFVRAETGALKIFKYADVGIDAVVIVTCDPLTDAERPAWSVPPGLFCGKTAQGLLMSSKGVALSKEVMRGGIVCSTRGVDEKRFYQFAHPRPGV
jgi:hypothetical protein